MLHTVEEKKNQKPRFLVSKYPYRKLNKTIFHGKQETHLINNKPGRAVIETRNGWGMRGKLTEPALWLWPALSRGRTWGPRPRQ